MSKKLNLAGQRFCRLLVESPAPPSRTGYARWYCVCDCGNRSIAYTTSLRSGQTKSCGCLQKELGVGAKKHGESDGSTKEYRTWMHIKARCLTKNHDKYHLYGGRGIKVCERWLTSYNAFLEDMGRAPSQSHSIDRIDSNGDYEASNCRWATKEEQMNNLRCNTKIALPDGSTKTVSQLSKEAGLKYTTVWQRHKIGLPYEKLIEPIKR